MIGVDTLYSVYCVFNRKHSIIISISGKRKLIYQWVLSALRMVAGTERLSLMIWPVKPWAVSTRVTCRMLIVWYSMKKSAMHWETSFIYHKFNTNAIWQVVIDSNWISLLANTVFVNVCDCRASGILDIDCATPCTDFMQSARCLGSGSNYHVLLTDILWGSWIHC